ncbi:carboxymuconolactone decarboxylase family protein [Actinacidiphila yeochonensis]|uniref:carboxymuconolactone decarboxylase family protein n=1 Tax=Actinacidiphila yeochonensis TaxID=89050 RepID=UPI000AA54F9E|nr:carboxymuconolactone decarboxylase family protein [Actinacidiphila yeochonensis]
MTVTAREPDDDAIAAHGRLFPGGLSTLAATDPELVGYFDGFAFGEVPRHTAGLPERTRLMAQLAATAAVGAVAGHRALLGAALTLGVTPVEAKEIVYQAVPYAGMARVLDVLHATNDVLAERGVDLPLPGQSTTTPATRAADGLAVQRRIVGEERVAAMHADAPADLRHIQELLSANCFGDHYTRTGIDVPTRELLTLAMLAALGGADAQVRGHVAANLRVGNDRSTLIAVLTALLPFIGYPRTLNALAAVDDIAPAPSAGEEA